MPVSSQLSPGGDGVVAGPLRVGPRAPRALQTVGLWTRPLGYLERCRARFGRTFTLRLLAQRPFVLLSDPADLKALFTAPPDALRPGEGARILEPVLGRGSLLLLDGERHLERRRLILPAFRGSRAGALSELVDELVQRAVAGWPRERPIRLQPLLQSLTLSVIMRAIFGPAEPSERLRSLHARVTELCEYGNASPLSAIPAERLPRRVGPHARFAALRAGTDELLFAEIAERRSRTPTGSGDGEAEVLRTLLGARREPGGAALSDEEIRDELMTLLIVGHETSATELAWAFELLSRAPEAQRRLIAGLDAGDQRYLEATINEVLRHRPVLPTASPRVVRRRTEIGGRSYEPGVSLVAAIYLTHHDPELYPDPHAFRPERFLGREPDTYSWLPFGGGRRRCVGSGLAMLELAAVLRAVLREGELRPAHPTHERPRRRSFAVGPERGAEVLLGARRRSPAPARR
jgi:cytochrome P450